MPGALESYGTLKMQQHCTCDAMHGSSYPDLFAALFSPVKFLMWPWLWSHISYLGLIIKVEI